MRSCAINRDPHRALRSDVVSSHRTAHLETLRSTPFESDEDSPFASNVNYAHGTFDAHAQHFSPAIRKLLSANAEIERVGFPFLSPQKPLQRLELDIEAKTTRPQRTQASLKTSPGPARMASVAENFDVAFPLLAQSESMRTSLLSCFAAKGSLYSMTIFTQSFCGGKILLLPSTRFLENEHVTA
jgi:hypothetical protein